jgi:hypothetical protein
MERKAFAAPTIWEVTDCGVRLSGTGKQDQRSERYHKDRIEDAV